MKTLQSLFLSQAYQDCWDDYTRSLKLKNFPRWDYVILTASNDQQAEGFRCQLEARKDFLPAGTTFVAIPDRNGERVGSGGATLEVLKYLHEQEGSFDGLYETQGLSKLLTCALFSIPICRIMIFHANILYTGGIDCGSGYNLFICALSGILGYLFYCRYKISSKNRIKMILSMYDVYMRVEENKRNANSYKL